ncbi:Naphthalene 1,2-dioxygenase/salicylate 5-hydroxylase system, ferredoxin component [Pirellulimonas nuda]|uniref:Naphthalene 1,2-dioxygenase/salicylate 5-hydroxylase system, ferredoxin component n=1 Tax=Pirellulimonas nuda TaxID=2528009 RepID=A0A518DF34_9BACT|nr:Rieske (2Fe-2S) protein [Pirellulimonas nuda]QDU90052.1 Naphthalene 1,2-dioxygenase/salicylate 5-hydroxylase system, ferredoxin component [Pirellulimonas nuda]
MAEWHDVAALTELSPGQVIEVIVGTEVVALANVAGQIFAIDGVCAHQGGPLGRGVLSREADGCRLTCPWHGWQYDPATGRQVLSQTIRQRVFPTRIAGDRIWVSVGAVSCSSQ